jgi:dihydroxyacetone kinase
MFLDDELEELWLAPARTPAWRRDAVGVTTGDVVEVSADDVEAAETTLQATPESRVGAATALTMLETVLSTLREHETELGRLDAVAGDGDHGRGMARGADAAVTAAREADGRGAGAADLLAAAGDAWAAKAGGTSGALWGSALRAVGRRLGNEAPPAPRDLAEAARIFVSTMQELGGAAVGDKTVLDAADPYAAELAARVAAGDELATAAASAATAARNAAQSTADLLPKVGRARPLAEKSKGTPDPGAVSFSLIVTDLAGLAR